MKRKVKRHSAIFMAVVMFLSLLLPSAPIQQARAADTTVETVTETNRTVQFTYIREDQTFGDWNIWVWDTGATDGEINFDTYAGDKAVADIAIGPDATEMGFVLRSTHDWNTAEKEFGDRFIPINKNDTITKAFVSSGVEGIRIVPDGSAPVIENGNATFFYRDKELFANDAMGSIEKVELKFNNETLPMTYEPENERFVYTYATIPNGEHAYTFLVTKDGVTTEVTDPYNTVNGVSTISYSVYELTVSGTITPAAIDYNENAVLTVDVQTVDGSPVQLSKLFADTTALGGSANFVLDPTVREITIAVDDDVTAGIKTIPISAVDELGNIHEGAATVEVKTRQMVGAADFDWDEAVIYFMLTDRFFDGDATNNNPYGLNYNSDYRGTHQGGDFEGITAKLDYLQNLGVNTIWISPIVENIKYDVRFNAEDDQPYHAYHGYWASNFENLNPYFGSIEEFHQLIDEAHARGMKLMVDVVVNHTGYGLKEIDGNTVNPPEGFPTDEDRARFSTIVRQGSNVGNDQVVGELAGLPDVITEDPAVRQQIIDWQTSWIEKATTTNGNTVDYFRVDTIKHVEDATWMAFKNALTKKMPEFKMIGEAWGADYTNDSGYLGTGMMDSILDFGFKDIAHTFVNGNLEAAHQSLIARNATIDNTSTLGQFLGSHDEDGFLHSLNGDIGKLKVATTLQATSKGQPVIYYGEELGQTGANNYPYYDNRYDLAWDQVANNDILSHYQKVLNFRGNYSKIFAKGDRTTIGGSNNDQYLLFSRNYQGENVCVGLNVADAAKAVTLTVDSTTAVITDHYSGNTLTPSEAGEVTITIPAKVDGGTVLLTVDGGTITGVIETAQPNTLRVHYQRTDQNYDNLGLWLWGDVVTPSVDWPVDGVPFEGFDSYGAFVDVPLTEDAMNVGFLVLNVANGDKEGGDKNVTITPDLNEIWIKQGSDEVFTTEPVKNLRIHYQRTDNNYENLGLWLWGDSVTNSENWPTGGSPFEGIDSYGAYIDVPLIDGGTNLGFLVLNVANGDKEGGDKNVTITSGLNEIWIKQGSDEVFTTEPVSGVPSNTIRIHYQRTDGNYENQGLWLWNDVAQPSQNWPSGGALFEKFDDYGAYMDVLLTDGAENIGFLVLNVINGEKDGGDKGFTITSPDMNEIWIKQGSDEVFLYEPVDLPANTVRIHYQNSNGYENLGLWNWEDVVEPSSNWPSGALPFANTDRYGAYVDVQLTEGAKKMGFLVVDRVTGQKDGTDKSFNLLDKYNRLWIKAGDDTVYISPYWEVATGLISAEVVSSENIQLGFTMTDGLTAEGLQNDLVINDSNGDVVTVDNVIIKDAKTVLVTASFDLNNLPLTVEYSGRTVTASTGWRLLDSMFAYDGNDLGATYVNGNVTLKLWAPKASQVVTNFYDKNNAANQIGTIALTKGDKGVWFANVASTELNLTDLEGYYYQYEVTNDGVTKKVLDPYAKSMAAFTVNTKGEAGLDGDVVGKAAIVNLSGTNPEGFDHATIDGYEKREDAIIYEAHVRDFTSDPSISNELNARWGSYKAFIDKIDYIKSLGVTHVQLLPVMAWYYGDETNMNERELEYSAAGNSYNWGYDPHSYFSPDGAYSENPEDASARVKELKELIDAIHDAGMGVVLDVVYTHMAQTSTLNDIVPNYYAFQDANGNFLGGFGNNLATNRFMAEKLMVDSVKHWFEEYKIDGMRFDMMGDATYPSVQNAFDAAAAINPDALFIGEGWRTFAGHVSDPSLAGMGADQDWMNKTNSVGVFSDEIRNELKSGFGSEGEPRFITGGARNIDVIFNNIKGQPSNTSDDDPGDMVQYIAAHDNLPLYDVIAQSIKKDPSIPENNLEIHKRIRLGNSMILTSQGTAFIHAGQEYGRTKQWLGEGVPEQKYHELKDASGNPFGYFIHDSYDSSDAINMFDWEKATNAELYKVNTTTRAFTEGLIKLRRSTNAFRLGTTALVDANVSLLEFPEGNATDLFIAYESLSTDDTGYYYVFVNADNQARSLTLGNYNFRGGKVLVDSDEAGTTEVSEQSGFVFADTTLTIDPLTTVVIKMTKRKANEPFTPEEVVQYMTEDFLAEKVTVEDTSSTMIEVAKVGDLTPVEVKAIVMVVALGHSMSNTNHSNLMDSTKKAIRLTGKDRAIETAGDQIERSLVKMLADLKKGNMPEGRTEKITTKQIAEALEKIKELATK